MKNLLLLSFILFSNISSANIENKKFSTVNLKKIIVKNMSGNIKVITTNDNIVNINANKLNFNEACSLIMNKNKDYISIEVKSDAIFKQVNCKVQFDIKIPKKEVALKFKSGSGQVDVTGTEGKIDFKLGSGDIKVVAIVDNLKGKSGSGSINIKGIIGSAILTAGSGEVDVSYKTVPSDGKLKIKSGSGNVLAIFPKNSKISYKLMSGSGETKSGFTNHKNANFSATLKSGSGNLTILPQ